MNVTIDNNSNKKIKKINITGKCSVQLLIAFRDTQIPGNKSFLTGKPFVKIYLFALLGHLEYTFSKEKNRVKRYKFLNPF